MFGSTPAAFTVLPALGLILWRRGPAVSPGPCCVALLPLAYVSNLYAQRRPSFDFADATLRTNGVGFRLYKVWP
jgi:hypothetical protein